MKVGKGKFRKMREREKKEEGCVFSEHHLFSQNSKRSKRERERERK